MNQEQLNQLEQTSVQIWLENGTGGRRFAGSGVLLSKEFVITARHILIDPAARARGELTGGPHPDAAAKRIFIDFGDNTNQLKISEVFCVGGDSQIGFQGDGARDICVLAVENPSAENLRRITWFPQPACERVPAGNPRNWNLRFLGWQQQPDGLIPAPSESKTIRSRRESNDTLTTTFQLIHGNSGGGVFDEQGRLVGLVSAGIGPTHNNLLVALIDPAKILFSDRKIDCRIEGAAVRRSEGEAPGQPEPEMSISFSGRHYRVVDRTSRTPNEHWVPLSANGIEMRLSFPDGGTTWRSDQIALNQRENSIIAKIFGPAVRSRPDRVSLTLDMREPTPPYRKLVLVDSNPVLSPSSANTFTIDTPVTVFDQARFVENKRKEANDIEESANKLINQRDTFRPLRTINQTQTASVGLRLPDLSRAYENNLENPAWIELRNLVRSAQEIRNEASRRAKDIDPFWAAAIRLQQIRFQVIAGQVCGARDEALALMKDIIALTNRGQDPSSSEAADETPRDTRNQSFLAAIRYPSACARPVSREDQIKETEELLKALRSLEKPNLLHPNRRPILVEMFPLISRFAPQRSAERFRQAADNDEKLQEIWNDWRSLVSEWCDSETPKRDVDSETPKRDVVTEWKEIEKTLGMEPGRRNTRACHGSSL
ncbi:MAG: trypsin-like peptidase domain-containing protein [Rhodocyclaceae bacterium]|nr:trypsin-like peptidase domain-containing protein [Rhodocyclaceae bacterium]